MTQQSNDEIRQILSKTRVIAVVGLSPNVDRASYQVARFMQQRGFRIIPVNPGQAGRQILGETVYADLAAIPGDVPVDMVDIFRHSEAVPEVVDAALAHLPGLGTIWMQLGVVHEASAAVARARGVEVVMDRCPKIEYPRVMTGV